MYMHCIIQVGAAPRLALNPELKHMLARKFKDFVDARSILVKVIKPIVPWTKHGAMFGQIVILSIMAYDVYKSIIILQMLLTSICP